jgi:hypothetical protein
MKLQAVVVLGLVACGQGPAPELRVEQAVYDCADPAQRFTCEAPADPDRRFICHATSSTKNPYNKLSVPLDSAHQPGVAHNPNKPADQSPGASADDVGGGAGLDCDCNERICEDTCTGAEPGESCDDGDPCTGDGACGGDTCEPGPASCVPGTPVDACTVLSGTCAPESGACGTMPLPAGTPCGELEVCDGNGGCVPAPRVVANEVESSGGVPGDWIELYNDSPTTADVSGWRLLDSDDTHVYVLPAGTTIAGGGYLVVDEASLDFGLGGADSVRVQDASGAAVDSYSWTAHAVTTYGRCPDGSGAFQTTTTTTKGGANNCAPAVKINEVESSGGAPGDWVELFNAGPLAVDISGWMFKDADDTHAYAIPSGTVIAAGGYVVLDEATFDFGLGGADSARLFDGSGAQVDGYAWTTHAPITYGRCPNGSGDFANTAAATKGAANNCSSGPPPATPWPGSATVTAADAGNVFGTNLSGIVRDGSVMWAVRNGPSTLFRLVWDGSIWVPDLVRTLRYVDGSGEPDAEDVTRAESGSPAIYVATERDNAAGSISRPSVLRFDLDQASGDLLATHEWNLASALPAVGANTGLEAITWIPDSYLTANGFFDESLGALYQPALYPGHGSGLFFVGLEANGAIYAFALDHVGGGFTRIATIASGDVTAKALVFDRDVGYLWTYCGAPCGGQAGVLTINATGRFAVRRQFARPAGMPNIANEGIAIDPEASCVAGQKRFWWTDDGQTDGFALRGGTVSCGAFVP